MKFPTPDDMSGVPHWENYLSGQFTQACLGELRPSVVCASIEIRGLDVTLIFEMDDADAEFPELRDIVDDLNDLTGDVLHVNVEVIKWEPGFRRDATQAVYQRWIDDALYT